MVIKTIIELQSKPGKLSELVEIMDGAVAAMRDVPGFRGITATTCLTISLCYALRK